MQGKLYQQYLAMRPSVRSLVFLYWIYAFVGGMVGVFTQLFLYQRFTSISLNVAATVVFYTGIMLGFCIPGFFAARWRLNIKQGFMWSFLFLGVSLLYLSQTVTMAHAYTAMLLWGFGQGIFWLTVNTCELSETKDGERDFYSSVLNAGNQILSLVGPAVATVLLWLSGSVFHFGTYTLLFSVAPAVYLLGFFCFSSIKTYRPKPIRFADITYFLTDRRNQAAQLYTMGTSFQQVLGIVVPPLAILTILGTALRVGMYDTLFAIFSAACILIVARYRTQQNRLAMYGVTTVGLVLAVLWFGYAFTFVALIIYTVVDGVLSPVMNVSSHVIDLNSMEIGRKESDFYATMLLRDFSLWVWRVAGGLLFLCVINLFGADKIVLSVGLYLLAGAFLLTYTGAFLLLKIRPR